MYVRMLHFCSYYFYAVSDDSRNETGDHSQSFPDTTMHETLPSITADENTGQNQQRQTASGSTFVFCYDNVRMSIHVMSSFQLSYPNKTLYMSLSTLVLNSRDRHKKWQPNFTCLKTHFEISYT